MNDLPGVRGYTVESPVLHLARVLYSVDQENGTDSVTNIVHHHSFGAALLTLYKHIASTSHIETSTHYRFTSRTSIPSATSLLYTRQLLRMFQPEESMYPDIQYVFQPMLMVASSEHNNPLLQYDDWKEWVLKYQNTCQNV